VRRRPHEPRPPGRRQGVARQVRHHMTFLDEVRARAAARPRRIVFPESDDERTQRAIAELERLRIVEPLLVNGSVDSERLATDLVTIRGRRGLTVERAGALARDPLFVAAAMVRDGIAD